MNATEATITAAPIRVSAVISSESTIQPRNTAITGLTYAYVDTRDTGACWSSQV